LFSTDFFMAQQRLFSIKKEEFLVTSKI